MHEHPWLRDDELPRTKVVVRPAWKSLDFGDWLTAVMQVQCGLCGAPAHARCRNHNAKEVAPHPTRNATAQERWNAARGNEMELEACQEDLDAAEAVRTCPWCGTLFDTVILMEGHEVTCE
jgi:hypothetical protein